jgi:hypothetical protein
VTPWRTLRTPWLAIAGAALSFACGGMSARDDAIATFSRSFSCPKDGLTVAEREATPPPDVATDPDRLAVWQKVHSSGSYFLIEGCGESRSFMCTGSGGCRVETR